MARILKGVITVEKVKVAFVGCGGISQFHLSHLITFDDVEYVGFYDIRPERAAGKAEFVGGAPVFSSLGDMLDTARPDALYVCVPPDQHGQIEREAIARKINFLVEKPMALSMELAYEIRDAAAKAGVIAAVGFQDRYLDIIAKTREIIAGRPVGLVDGAWVGGIPGVYWWPRYSTSGGQIVEQNIHHFDMLRYLFGEPASVFVSGARGLVSREGYDLHDYTAAVVTMKSGVIATMHTGCYRHDAPDYGNGLQIHGEDFDLHYYLRNHIIYNTQHESLRIDRVEDAGVTEDRTFINAVKSGDPSALRSPYADACKTLELVLACNRSLELGAPVYF